MTDHIIFSFTRNKKNRNKHYHLRAFLASYNPNHVLYFIRAKLRRPVGPKGLRQDYGQQAQRCTLDIILTLANVSSGKGISERKQIHSLGKKASSTWRLRNLNPQEYMLHNLQKARNAPFNPPDLCMINASIILGEYKSILFICPNKAV